MNGKVAKLLRKIVSIDKEGILHKGAHKFEKRAEYQHLKKAWTRSSKIQKRIGLAILTNPEIVEEPDASID